MNKDNAIALLVQRIKEEEKRTRQRAEIVCISRSVGCALAAMTASDWQDASRGFTTPSECMKLADDFLKDGEAAANGLRLWPTGPVLEVSTNQNAPDVEITKGTLLDVPVT